MQALSWQQVLADGVTSPLELLRLLNLEHLMDEIAEDILPAFPMRVPRGFVARMEKANAEDPLLRQVLPIKAERLEPEGYSVDPVNEQDANRVPGLLHKYHGRVLLTVTGACAIHCRYCFRRHFPYGENNLSSRRRGDALAYIAADPSISEVILSGGDPLLATNHSLRVLGAELAAIGHLKRLRIHTRLPIVLPERVDTDFLAWLKAYPLQTVMMIHCNHAQEINGQVKQAINALREAGLLVFNQTVLLKGVNDSVAAQAALSEALFDAGVIPYYLHLLDKVTGAAHFDVNEEQAKKIMHGLKNLLPGYLVPKLVKEVAGEAAKIVI